MKKSKVCLVFPPHMRIDAYYVTPPLSLIALGSVLERDNVSVEVQDHIFMLRSGLLPENKFIYDASAAAILESEADIVGFHTQCVTYSSCLNIAKRVKEKKPDTLILFGGHNSSFLDVETLRTFPYVDAVIRGEAETTLPEFVKTVDAGGSLAEVKGITYRFKDDVKRNPDQPLIDNLDSLPLPAYHLVPHLSEYRKLGKTLTVLIESGRGCSYNCVFCSNCRLWERKVRYKSIPRVLEEIRFLKDNYAPDEYYLIHDFFTHNLNYVHDFCDSITSSGLDVQWHCRCRLNVDREILQKMKKAGCERLLYGVESGSQKILQFIHKRIDFEKMYGTIKSTIDAGIKPSLSFVMGLPEESLDDVNDTLRLILKCELLGNCYPFMQMVSPLPGTPLLENYSQEMERITPTAFSRGITYDEGKMLREDEELIKEFPVYFSTFYNLRNKNEDLVYVGEIARNFCIISEMFAYVYYYLTHEFGVTEVELYGRWRDWLLKRSPSLADAMAEIPRADIWGYFKEFLDDTVAQHQFAYRMIPDLYRYQLKTFDLNTRASNRSSQGGSLSPLQDRARIALADHVSVERFDYDIPQVLLDLKEHRVKHYDRKECYLLLFRNGYNLSVKKITPFLYHLLKSADNIAFDELLEKLQRQFVHTSKDAITSQARQALSLLAPYQIFETSRGAAGNSAQLN